MKLQILALFLVLALLLAACTGPSTPTTSANTPPTSSAPTGSTPADPNQVFIFSFDRQSAILEMISQTEASFALTVAMEELDQDIMRQIGLEGTAKMFMVSKLVGTYTEVDGLYTLRPTQFLNGITFDYPDEAKLRQALVTYLENEGSGDEEIISMIRDGFVDVTEDSLEEGQKVCFRLNGKHFSLMEIYEDEDCLSARFEFHDNGNLMRYSTYFDQLLYRVDEFRADGSQEKTTVYHDNGNVQRLVIYDEHGNEVLSTYYNEDGSESHKLEKQFTYYDNGQIKTYKYLNSSGQVERSGEYFADGTEKVVAWYYDNGQIESITEYNAYGHMILSGQYFEDGTPIEILTIEYVYSDAGVRVSSDHYDGGTLAEHRDYHANGTDKLRTRYYDSGNVYSIERYDEMGRSILREAFPDTPDAVAGERNETEYLPGGISVERFYLHDVLQYQRERYASGYRKSQTDYYSNGQIETYQEFADLGWYEGNRTLYIRYDESGNIEEYERLELEYYESGNMKARKYYNQHDVLVESFTYDEDGRNMDHIYYDENGQADWVMRWEYEMSEDGLPIAIRTYTNDILTQEDLYDAEGLLISRTQYYEDTGTIYCRCEWYEDGSWVEIYYDTDGNETHRYEYY